MEGETAIVAALPGHREVRVIATPARLEPVAAVLSELRGQRTRIVLEAQPASESRTAAGDEPSGTSAAAAGRDAGSFDRRAAMQVPLVRQAMEFFPDATVIDAREQRTEPKPESQDDKPRE